MSKTFNILVADSNDLIKRSMQRILKNHNVTIVSSGEDAIEAVCENPNFDVILSSTRLDGYVDGVQFCKWLTKRFPQLAKKFVFLSAQDAMRHVAEEMGVNFVPKPSPVEDLLKAINQVATC